MADNYTTNPGSGGPTFAADDVGGSLLVPRVKLQQGADGSAVDISSAAPMHVQSVKDLRFKVYADTSFVTGDSPVSHDVNTDLTRDGEAMTVVNDGPGTFTVAVSNDGASFSDEWTLRDGEKLDLKDLAIDTIRTTWVSDTAYRILVI